MRRALAGPTFVLNVFLPLTALAWGPTGHRTVGEIAEHHLSKKAAKAVQRILGDEGLAIASTWMDDVRSDSTYDGTHDWHWVTIPDGSTYAASVKNPDGDVVEAIGRMQALLRSDTVPLERQRIHLRMLIHLVGDLHQSLHVGRGDDKGGNDFQVQWMKKGSNLHRVWDSGMIELDGLSYTELAASLDHPSAAQCNAWKQGTPAQWAEEALALRPRIYAVQRGSDLGYAYKYRNWSVVQEQLLKGGIRLAAILNAIYG
ncbi:MAG: S1/P1 nuclease [Flavobacteriales bacterium]